MKPLRDLNKTEITTLVLIALVPTLMFLIAVASFNCGAEAVDEWKVKDVAPQEQGTSSVGEVIEHHDDERDISCYIYKEGQGQSAAAAIHCVQIWRFKALEDQLKEFEP